VKNAEAFERLSTLDTVVVDKTGTLTEGRPALVDVTVFDSRTEHEALAYPAALKQPSERPLAQQSSMRPAIAAFP
jgi:Cu+-exporting ATPase